MDIVRTTKVKIMLDHKAAIATIKAWNKACNYASQVSFENGNILNPAKLHKLVYYDIKDKFGLSAQLAVSVERHVCAKYKTIKSNGRIPKRAVRFHNTAAVLQGGVRGRDFAFRKNGLSIWTTSGRIKNVKFKGSPKLVEYIDEWKLGDARLFVDKKGRVFIAVSFTKSIEIIDKPNNVIVGVDRGINNLAVVADEQHCLFLKGGDLKQIRSRYQRTRASLQRKKALGNTRSIRRVLKRQSGKQARFTKDTNHVVSKAIVEFAKTTGNPVIAIEDLKGITKGKRRRKQQRTDLNQWPFYQLEQFILYKADNLGFEVIKVPAHNTSIGCSKCGHTVKSNRKKHDFSCKACNLKLHADLNAARNIRLRGIVARQELYDNGLHQPALKHADSGVEPEMNQMGKPHDLSCGS